MRLEFFILYIININIQQKTLKKKYKDYEIDYSSTDWVIIQRMAERGP